MNKFTVVSVLCLLALIEHSSATCFECMANGVACRSQNEFSPCFEKIMDNTTIFKCPNPDAVCTESEKVCMTGIAPICGDLSNCGKCDIVTDGGYACTSKTTYTLCFNFNPSQTELKCPPGYICDIVTGATGNFPCVDKCLLEYSEVCNKNADIEPESTPAPSTPTPTPSTPDTSTPTPTPSTPDTSTPTPTPSTPDTSTPTPSTPDTSTPAPSTPTSSTPTPKPEDSVCQNQGTAGRYPYPNDTVCTTYVYCYRKGNVWRGTSTACPTNKYFNKRTTMCETTKPEGCI